MDLQTGRNLSIKSKLLSLSPFIDSEGILRVGGRLQRSNLIYDSKHPMMLPATDALVEKIVEYEHLRLLHEGPELLMSNLRRKFWILNARMVVLKNCSKCVTCVRHRGKTLQQMMGSLSSVRVNSQRAFLNKGVDFAGPFIIRAMKGRGLKRFKAYLCIFVCKTTRAIHVDLVSNLTTEAVLATLRRFVSRRAKPAELWSDCGTNFVGSNRELQELSQFLRVKSTQEVVSKQLLSEGISWRFNPPGARHFGGLWEVGEKSMKYHLKRIMGNSVFTFEEIYTALTQIASCLNSRPLCPLSADPDDLGVFPPGRFLTGTVLTAVSDTDVTDVGTDILNRWQLIQSTVQHFWRHWSREFIFRMQQLPKWWTAQPNLKVGAIVLFKDEILPPLNWKIGRVVQVHPDSTNVVRVATVKTAQGKVKRPIEKLALLPVYHQGEHQT